MLVGSVGKIFKNTNHINYNMYYYKLIDRDSGEHYIGSCICLKKRLSQHKCGKQVSASKIIKNDNYDIIVLECSDDYDRLTREQYWMDKHPNRINERPAVRKISKKEYNRKYMKIYARWKRSFGDERYTNSLWKIDPMVFLEN